jgi:alanine-glyoxylate transaminase/(R)-3-amino-2-methylpropionate-pyruvate transaminase
MKRAPALPSFDHEPTKYAGPSADKVLQLRKEFLNPGIFLYYKKPLMLVEGKMQYVWDEHGRRYLDALGGIVTVSVGHCHSDVVDVARRQNETLQQLRNCPVSWSRRRRNRNDFATGVARRANFPIPGGFSRPH